MFILKVLKYWENYKENKSVIQRIFVALQSHVMNKCLLFLSEKISRISPIINLYKTVYIPQNAAQIRLDILKYTTNLCVKKYSRLPRN